MGSYGGADLHSQTPDTSLPTLAGTRFAYPEGMARLSWPGLVGGWLDTEMVYLYYLPIDSHSSQY